MTTHFSKSPAFPTLPTLPVFLAAALLSLAATLPLLAQPAAKDKPAQPDQSPQSSRPDNKKLIMGDPAPPLKVAKWVKGDEIKSFEKGTVYVVEFWATWSGNCRKSIPHLTEIAKKYKDKGVKAIGVAIWEETVEKDGKTPRNALQDVEKFVADMGDKMAYHVAFGGDQAEMADTWMRPAGRVGIPSTFIVDKEGRIAWIGLPFDGMDETLEQVVSGKFDPKSEAELLRKKTSVDAKAAALGKKVIAAMQGGRAKEALDTVREMMRLDPLMFPRAAGTVFQRVMVDMGEQELAYEFAKEMFAGPIKDNAQDLNTIAWVILDDAAVKKRDINLAFDMSKRAVELTEEKEPATLDTLARAYWEKGDPGKAIELQLKAVDLANKNPSVPDSLRKTLETSLANYKKGRK